MKKRIICGFIFISMLLLLFKSVSATEIDVTYDNIKITVNGEPVYPEGSPFIYCGRTFIPARAVVEAMGGTVTWDENTKTVQIYKNDLTDLQNLAYGIYISRGGQNLCLALTRDIGNFLTYRNYRMNGDYVTDLLKIYTSTFNLQKDLFYNTAMTHWKDSFELYSECGWYDIETIKLALFYCNLGIENLQKAYDLIAVNPYANIDDLIHSASYHINEAYKIFTDCSFVFLNLTLGNTN